MINHVIERLAAESHGQACHMGEIGRTQPAGMMSLCEEDLLGGARDCFPLTHSTLKRGS